jgi:glucose/arabinose dehydrogenase
MNRLHEKIKMKIVAGVIVCLSVIALDLGFDRPARAADAPREDDYYKITKFKIPDGLVLEAGALQLSRDGRLAFSTRRGDIYWISNPFAADPAKDSKFVKFASGLHEVLGLAERDGVLYAMQRCELTKLLDDDGDGRADRFETVADGWEISGDYHEYGFCSKFDKNGDIWIALTLTGSFTSDVKFRGWCLRLKPDGSLVPTCSGLRSPGGVGANASGDMFYTENQGPWNGACALKHLEPGAFLGHPAGFKWYDLAKNLGKRPDEPKSDSRLIEEAKRIPELSPPAIYFPYSKMGQSASGIACDTTDGKFGPFYNQLFVGDQTASTVMRVDLEKVNGRYQGACFPFREGFSSGNLALELSPSGSLFVGGTNRGWGSRGSKEFALERLDWTGKVPFEILEMRARHDGFKLTFTEPVDSRTAGDPKSYQIETYTYIYQANYGSPEVDQTKPEIASAVVSDDHKSVVLTVKSLAPGHVHELHLPGVRSAEGAPLLHPAAYYTMNAIPAEESKP